MKLLRSILPRLPNFDPVKTKGYKTSAKVIDGKDADYFVDLRSDTVTRPNAAMREVMAKAIVGDDVFDEDPTVKDLECRVAQLLGKQNSLFVPSGTMSNLLAVLVHCTKRGSEIIVGDQAHMFYYEQGNISQFGGVHSNQIPNNPDGTFSIEGIQERIRVDDPHHTITSLIAVENTHNRCGGRVMPLKWLDEVSQVAKQNGIPTHMDGARIFNASLATGESVSRIAEGYDSVSVCLSKNLGAPLGSLLVGDEAFIKQARRLRKALGGGMRQIGIIAASGIYCLDNMIDRIREDHANAKHLAAIVNAMKSPYVFVETETLETHFVMLQLRNISVDKFCERLAIISDVERNSLGHATSVISAPRSETSIRLVFHCDVSPEMATKAAEKICYTANEFISSS